MACGALKHREHSDDDDDGSARQSGSRLWKGRGRFGPSVRSSGKGAAEALQMDARRPCQTQSAKEKKRVVVVGKWIHLSPRAAAFFDTPYARPPRPHQSVSRLTTSVPSSVGLMNQSHPEESNECVCVERGRWSTPITSLYERARCLLCYAQSLKRVRSNGFKK